MIEMLDLSLPHFFIRLPAHILIESKDFTLYTYNFHIRPHQTYESGHSFTFLANQWLFRSQNLGLTDKYQLGIYRVCIKSLSGLKN